MVASVSGIHLSGTHAARPAANAVPDGSLYSCTTDALVYKSSFAGNSWSTWATLGGSGSVATDAIWDAKGDLAGGTGANTAARLAVGTNGQVLTADSAEATGMKWAAGLADQGAFTYLDATEAGAPGTPGVGKVRIYAKADGRVYSKDDGGIEYGPFDVAGGGSGLPAYGVDWMRYPTRLGLVGMIIGNHVNNPYGASDGLLSTAANSSSVTVPQAHGVDLGASRAVTACRVVYGSAANISDDGELQYSSDGSSWSAAATWTNDTSQARVHTFASVTARYWRIYTTQTGNPGAAGVDVKDFRLINAGTDHASGKTPTYNQATNNPTNATDNDDGTSANQTNGSMPQWCRLDLTAAQSISRARAVFSGDGNRPADLKVQYSTDDASWNDVSGASSATGGGVEQIFDFTAVTARYWRFYIAAAASSGNGINWSTVEFWGA